MDTRFKLDTSGCVPLGEPSRVGVLTARETIWSDLTPFAQGYVEALLKDAPNKIGAKLGDLSPEALATILADCESVLRIVDLYADAEKARNQGEVFWTARANGRWELRGFPPLTPYLADDGKIHLKPPA